MVIYFCDGCGIQTGKDQLNRDGSSFLAEVKVIQMRCFLPPDNITSSKKIGPDFHLCGHCQSKLRHSIKNYLINIIKMGAEDGHPN